MTNGENLKNIYPDLEIIGEIKDVYVIMLETHNVLSPKLEVFKSWWNAEYKEPSSSENPNKSKNPTGSTTKNGISNRTIIYKAKESKDIQEDLEKLEKLKEPITKNDLGVDCISRAEVIDYLCKHCPDDGECFKDCDEIKHLRQMPSVTPQEPRKGEWLRMSDLSEQEDDRYRCSYCGNVIHHKSKMDLYTFNSWCGRCGSDNGKHINYEVEE